MSGGGSACSMLVRAGTGGPDDLPSAAEAPQRAELVLAREVEARAELLDGAARDEAREEQDAALST